MEFERIADLDIPQLQIYRQLRDNHVTQENAFIADSPKVCAMLLQSDLKIHSILATESFYTEHQQLIESKSIPRLYVADKDLMKSIVGHTVHHGVMMHGVRPAENPLNDLGDKIIMLDQISKNENVGAIARSAAALGVDSMVVSGQGPHPYGRRALRVSMGHTSKLKIHIYQDLLATISTLKDLGYRVFAAEASEAARGLQQITIPEKWVMLMGHEGHGLSEEVQQACDDVVKIEMMPGIKSFNVSTAASILMYTFVNKKNA